MEVCHTGGGLSSRWEHPGWKRCPCCPFSSSDHANEPLTPPGTHDGWQRAAGPAAGPPPSLSPAGASQRPRCPREPSAGAGVPAAAPPVPSVPGAWRGSLGPPPGAPGRPDRNWPWPGLSLPRPRGAGQSRAEPSGAAPAPPPAPAPCPPSSRPSPSGSLPAPSRSRHRGPAGSCCGAGEHIRGEPPARPGSGRSAPGHLWEGGQRPPAATGAGGCWRDHGRSRGAVGAPGPAHVCEGSLPARSRVQPPGWCVRVPATGETGWDPGAAVGRERVRLAAQHASVCVLIYTYVWV